MLSILIALALSGAPVPHTATSSCYASHSWQFEQDGHSVTREICDNEIPFLIIRQQLPVSALAYLMHDLKAQA